MTAGWDWTPGNELPRTAPPAYICAHCMLICTRTTLQLDDELVVQAKIRAARGVNLDDNTGLLDLMDRSR